MTTRSEERSNATTKPRSRAAQVTPAIVVEQAAAAMAGVTAAGAGLWFVAPYCFVC